nr:hypothetical protein [Tanacetum cinerariifolium]
MINGLSSPTYYRTLDANILRELIGSNGRLILEEIAPSILRVATPRAPRPTTSDLYDKISQLETRLGEIERMTCSKMTTLAKHIIVARAENHPPMLKKSMYDSWESHIRLFIKGKKHGRMMIDSIDYGPLVYPTVEENRLYNLFDKFAYVQGENLYEYYCRFYPGIDKVQVAQQTILQNSAFQTKNLDAYDSDCDDISLAKAVQMENISTCDPDVLSEVAYYDSYPKDMINQDVQEMPYSKQTHIDDYLDNEINSDRNIIPYSQYLQESQDAVIQDTNSSAPNDLLVLSLVEQITDHVANLDKENQINKMVNESLTAELKRYKEQVAIFEQRLNVNLNKRENLIDSQMNDLIWNKNAKLVAFQQ